MAGALPQGLPPAPNGSLPPGITPSPETPFSAYVHVPYCRVRCGYCDFNTYTNDELRGSRRESYVEVVAHEIELAQRVMAAAGVRLGMYVQETDLDAVAARILVDLANAGFVPLGFAWGTAGNAVASGRRLAAAPSPPC